MSKEAQGYFVVVIVAVLLLIGSFHATMKIGDVVSRVFF